MTQGDSLHTLEEALGLLWLLSAFLQCLGQQPRLLKVSLPCYV